MSMGGRKIGEDFPRHNILDERSLRVVAGRTLLHTLNATHVPAGAAPILRRTVNVRTTEQDLSCE